MYANVQEAYSKACTYVKILKPRNLARRDMGQREREVAKGGKLSNETGDGKTRLMKGEQAPGQKAGKETRKQ